MWAHQPWYPVLLDTLVEMPILLPLTHSLLLDPFNQPHPLVLSRNLLERDSLQRAFRTRLPASSMQDGVRVQTAITALEWGTYLAFGIEEMTLKGVLLCASFDLPAAHKTCGFLSHSTALGCSKCFTYFPGEVGSMN